MATITLKNIPRQLHRRLKERAEENHRSLNCEVIATLERTIGSGRVDPTELLLKARRLRSRIEKVTPSELAEWRNTGRP